MSDKSPYDHLIGCLIYSSHTPEDPPEMVRAVHRVTEGNFSDWHGRTEWLFETTCRHTGAGFVPVESILDCTHFVSPTPAELRAWRKWRPAPANLDKPIPF